MLDTLKNKNNLIALVGASNDPKKYGNKILLDLVSKGYDVVPINSTGDTIAGIKSYKNVLDLKDCLLYTSPSPRDKCRSRMPSSA